MRRFLVTALVAAMSFTCSFAQRVTDKLDRGLVAVPMNSGGYLVTWRKFGSEYYDTRYNLYRNGAKIADNLEVTNFVVAGGTASDTYQVEAVVRGVAQPKSAEAKAWAQQYKEVKVQPVVNRSGKTIGNAVTNGNSNSEPGYTLNDVTLADVDGDGICELIVKRNNDTGNRLDASNKTDFNLYECYKLDGTRLWWIDLGPNLMAGPDEQWDMIGYDWDMDGKAEMLMRGADNMIIHTATGKTINVGDMSYFAPRDEYTHQGAEYLLYLNGATGEPFDWDGSENYQPMDYPLPRFEAGESNYAAVWGASDTGHRSSKHYFGAPYLDGRHPSIFLGRGCYTRHKMCALDVDPATHKLTQRWRWNCYDSSSPWFGNGFHNFAIADVDMDGRDEIVFGSMIIDDTGYGLATTGLGHGDAQHCGDLDPYRWGLEQFTCQEGSQGNSYWNATTGDLYYRKADGGDDGRALAGNFTNDFPGGQGRSVSSGIIGLSSDKIIKSDGDNYMAWGDLNNRIFWDGDLLDEILNSPGVQRSVKITKWGNGRLSFYNSDGLYTPTGILNNSSKNNPSAQGDILGDWREELVLRTSDNTALHIYTTNYASNYGIYTLWHDHQYRNGMAWQCVGYNQPPHVSYFLGELEGITMAPPPLMLEGRTEVANGATIQTTDDHLLMSGYENMTATVADGASPYILTVNAPAWVQGTGDPQASAATPKSPARTVVNYTYTLTGGAFSGATRLVKQGEGTLVLPNVVEKHTGNTDIWGGTLQFDGTMESSPVWLNRHTTLISDGGKFLAGLKADYNATIQPGGVDKQGEMTVSTLTLGFGSRVVFDAVCSQGDNALNADKIAVDKLIIETKAWEYGPKYKAPVFQFKVVGDISEGRYELGTVGAIEGKVSDILIEGLGGKRFFLDHQDGRLYLVVEGLRGATSVVWNGTAGNSVWDLAESKNFLNGGEADYAVTGDDIIFDDQAASTTVTVKGAVSPKSITFRNETKAYVLKGDSILGGGAIIKNGQGSVTINNENRTGTTTINGGKLIVNQLANNTGQKYGSLGDVKQQININDGATLSVQGTIITDQPISVDGDATLDVPTGSSLRINQGLKGSAVVNKSGAGSLTTGSGNTYSKLVIKQGTVYASVSGNVDQLPGTVEFQGGTLWGTTDDSNSHATRANFIVPEGKTGTYYGSYRGTNSGKLTGSGTFNVYSGGVRCYWNGDWSEFEGTLVPSTVNRQAKPTYTPTFNFTNSKGIPNATLKLNNDVTVYNNDPANSSTKYNVEIGNVIGTGTLAGTGTYILGVNGSNIVASFSATAPVIKRGDGYMEALKIGSISGGLEVQGGELRFNDTNMTTPYFGTKTMKVSGTGSIVGSGLLASLTMESGTQMTPYLNLDLGGIIVSSPSTIKTNAAVNIKKGAVVNIMIQSTSEYSKLEPKYFTMNGTVKVTLMDGYTPKAGDSFTIWDGGSFSGEPAFDLPQLPAGLYWDTRAVAAKTGVLSITDDSTVGIDGLSASALLTCEVYTVGGACVGRFEARRSDIRSAVRRLGVQPGAYVVRISNGKTTDSETVIIK